MVLVHFVETSEDTFHGPEGITFPVNTHFMSYEGFYENHFESSDKDSGQDSSNSEKSVYRLRSGSPSDSLTITNTAKRKRAYFSFKK